MNMNNVKTWEQFNESYSLNEELSDLQIEYRKYFRALLDCYGVKSPMKLSEKKKKEFFNNVNKYWTKGKGPTKDIEDICEEICGEEGC